MARIDVYVQVGRHPSERDVRISKPLDSHLVEKTFVPLDYPKTDAAVFTRMICSPPQVLADVTLSRRRIAAMLSESITAAIVEAMGAQDTEQGYPKCKS